MGDLGHRVIGITINLTWENIVMHEEERPSHGSVIANLASRMSDQPTVEEIDDKITNKEERLITKYFTDFDGLPLHAKVLECVHMHGSKYDADWEILKLENGKRLIELKAFGMKIIMVSVAVISVAWILFFMITSDKTANQQFGDLITTIRTIFQW